MYLIEAGPIRVTRNTNIEDNMSYKVGDIVKGKYAGMFRIKGFRTAAGYEGADLIPLNPETLQAGRHPSMWMQIENISPMDADMDVRHPSGLVWMKA